MRSPVILLPLLASLAACNPQGATDATTPAGESPSQAYAGIGAGEVLRFTGTEPFWGGSVTGGSLTYTTPEDPAGTTIAVRRFAGNNGLAFSGSLGGSRFDMAVSEALCSDGMSDRSYPFSVTLRIADDLRRGCGWTDARRFTGPENP